MNEDRLTALEERIAYQDQAIEDLNATILTLLQDIDSLKRQLARLGEQLADVAADVPRGPEPPPPHY